MDMPQLRPAKARDLPEIVGLIGELAEFEKLTHLMQVTPDILGPHLFGPKRVAECVVADHSGKLVGFALFFPNFSTFLGKPGIYLEDLYVQPAWRGHGLGKALFDHVAGIAVERGCGRFEWAVLDWNTKAIEFYERKGATLMPEWRLCRLTGPALAAYGR